MEEKFLTIKEVCAILKVDRSTLNRWAKDGTLPRIKVVGSIRYKQSVITAKFNNDQTP